MAGYFSPLMDVAESSECRISSSTSIKMTMHMGYSMDAGDDEIGFDPWRPWERTLNGLSAEKTGTLLITLSIRNTCPEWWVPLIAQWQQMSISQHLCYKRQCASMATLKVKRVRFDTMNPSQSLLLSQHIGGVILPELSLFLALKIPLSGSPGTGPHLAPHWPSDRCL